MAKKMLEMKGLFDDGLDVEAVNKAVDQQLECRLVKLEDTAQRSGNSLQVLVRVPTMRSFLGQVFSVASSIRGRSMPQRS